VNLFGSVHDVHVAGVGPDASMVLARVDLTEWRNVRSDGNPNVYEKDGSRCVRLRLPPTVYPHRDARVLHTFTQIFKMIEEPWLSEMLAPRGHVLAPRGTPLFARRRDYAAALDKNPAMFAEQAMANKNGQLDWATQTLTGETLANLQRCVSPVASAFAQPMVSLYGRAQDLTRVHRHFGGTHKRAQKKGKKKVEKASVVASCDFQKCSVSHSALFFVLVLVTLSCDHIHCV
jgi:hypothetical protein